MNEQTEAGSGVCQVPIEGELSIYSAGRYLPDLLGQLERSQELELDLAGVTEMDSAGVQLLLVLKREAELAGKPLRLTHHSHAVYEVLELLRLQARFGAPVVISADWKTA